MPAPTNTRHILLLGAGHSHVQVLTRLAMHRPAGLSITLVTDRALAPYSGMLPGCVAGDYAHHEIHIDAVRLSRATGADLILARASGLDLANRRLLLADRAPLPFDILSINTGITPDLSALPGAAEHALAVKPIATLLASLDPREARLRQQTRAVRCVIVGGGPAGFEMALALKDRWTKSNLAIETITLIAGRGLLPELNTRARRLGQLALAQAGIRVITGRATEIMAEAVRLDTGELLPADLCLVATAARVPEWLQKTGLQLAENGGIAIGPTLQSSADPLVFAAGDCATLSHDPRPRAGVFAVRQGPVLADNLLRLVEGRPLTSYVSQREFLTLLRLDRKADGTGRAIASRGRWLAAQGTWLWTLKDRIDRDFMAMFTPDAIGPDAMPDMLCRGCAAKVGPETLQEALRDALPTPGTTARQSQDKGPEDAALIRMPDQSQLLATIDLIPAFVSDPYRFGQILAVHALNDIFAMGGTPHHALALAVLPEVGATRQRLLLGQMLAGARSILDQEHVTLAGGHSATGHELAFGLSMTGVPGQRLLEKGGSQPGDALILTKPLGSGLLLAAEMRRVARGEAVAEALSQMARSSGQAAWILVRHGARAMTDVTGFGLAGHLAEMLRAGPEPRSAMLSRSKLPLLPDVRRLAELGYHSTALQQNRLQISALDAAGAALPFWLDAILFDPQTAGGLLASVPQGRAADAVVELHQAGYAHAAIIGEIQAGPGSALQIVD
jgi:selenide, water dikinase